MFYSIAEPAASCFQQKILPHGGTLRFYYSIPPAGIMLTLQIENSPIKCLNVICNNI